MEEYLGLYIKVAVLKHNYFEYVPFTVGPVKVQHVEIDLKALCASAIQSDLNTRVLDTRSLLLWPSRQSVLKVR